jgi:hypothetical protein
MLLDRLSEDDVGFKDADPNPVDKSCLLRT